MLVTLPAAELVKGRHLSVQFRALKTGMAMVRSGRSGSYGPVQATIDRPYNSYSWKESVEGFMARQSWVGIGK